MKVMWWVSVGLGLLLGWIVVLNMMIRCWEGGMLFRIGVWYGCVWW